MHGDQLRAGTRNFWITVRVERAWTAAYRMMPDRRTRLPVIAEIRIFPFELSRPVSTIGNGRWSADDIEMGADQVPMERGVKAYLAVPTRGITSRVLKAVRLGDRVSVVNEFLAELAEMRRQRGTADQIGPDALLDAFRLPPVVPYAPRRGPARGRPPQLSDTDYARVARDYLAALNRRSRHAARDVAKKHRLRSAAQVRMRVLRAKQRGLVARQPQERALMLTEAGQAALASGQREKRKAKRKKKRGRRGSI